MKGKIEKSREVGRWIGIGRVRKGTMLSEGYERRKGEGYKE